MYTVILYRKGNVEEQGNRKLTIERFRFVFAAMEQEDRLVFCEWGIETNISDVIRKVDNFLGSHRVWRLLVFQGAQKMELSDHAVSSVDYEIQKLLRFYAKSALSGIKERCKYYPEEVWYAGWMEKTDMLQLNEMVLNGLVDPSVSNLRVFGIVASLESRMEQRYSEFMICCSLLILAVNQFPIGFLSSRYMYFIQLEYERRQFAEYVNAQYEDMLELKRRIDLEKQRLQKAHTGGIPCPEYIPVELEKSKRGKVPDIGDMKERIQRKGTVANVEHALNRNGDEIRGWMNYPRGIMSGKVDKLSEELDVKDMAEGFLSISGREGLKRETRSALEKLSIQRKVSVDMRGFEYGLRRREERIRKEAGKRTGEDASWMRKFFPFTFLGFMEALFGIGLFRLTSFFEISTVETIGLGAAIFFLTVVGLELSMLLSYWYAKMQYIRFLKKEMETKTKSKDAYLYETLGYIAKYQYYVRLGKEQRKLEQQWEQENKRLEQYMYICHQNEDIVQQLQYLLDIEDIPVLPEGIRLSEKWLDLDFTKEPQKISDFWTQHKNSRSRAELNHSGYRMETLFDFIIRFKCVIDYREIMIDDQ